MTSDNTKDDLYAYRISSLTLLQLMAVLAILGVVTHCVLQYFW